MFNLEKKNQIGVTCQQIHQVSKVFSLVWALETGCRDVYKIHLFPRCKQTDHMQSGSWCVYLRTSLIVPFRSGAPCRAFWGSPPACAHDSFTCCLTLSCTSGLRPSSNRANCRGTAVCREDGMRSDTESGIEMQATLNYHTYQFAHTVSTPPAISSVMLALMRSKDSCPFSISCPRTPVYWPPAATVTDPRPREDDRRWYPLWILASAGRSRVRSEVTGQGSTLTLRLCDYSCFYHDWRCGPKQRRAGSTGVHPSVEVGEGAGRGEEEWLLAFAPQPR